MMSTTYLPPTEAVEWYREHFDNELTRLEEMAERYEPTGDYVNGTREAGDFKEGMQKALRLVRYQMLRPTNGCVITMFDPRMRQLMDEEPS